jgi:hypothetical protein
MKRTDCHRPGAIVPSDYEYFMSYVMPGSEPWDQFNMDYARQVCEKHGWGKDGRMHGHMGKCGICGASYRYGDIWTHTPTGHIIHVGQNCAHKYEMLADRDDFNAALESLKQRRAAFINAEKNRVLREAFLARTPGLEEALQGDHHILRNLSESLSRWHSLTPKQVAFAMKLSAEAKERANKPVEVEKHVPAPLGRQIIVGRVVSRKSYDSAWGETTKVTVKVETPEGSWLAWGSNIDCRLEEGQKHHSHDTNRYASVGDLIEFRATLKPGRDPHFAFFKRPSNGRLLEDGKN